jgi:hypothetical protein
MLRWTVPQKARLKYLVCPGDNHLRWNEFCPGKNPNEIGPRRDEEYPGRITTMEQKTEENHQNLDGVQGSLTRRYRFSESPREESMLDSFRI